MGISEFSELIAQYGLVPILVAMALCIGWLIFNDIRNRKKTTQNKSDYAQGMDKMFEMMEKMNGFIERQEKENEAHLDTEAIPVFTQRINHLMRAAREELQANRIFILEYHNGGVAASNLPFSRFSMTYESISPLIEPIINKFQNQHCSMLSFIYEHLLKDHGICLPCIEDIKHDDSGLFYLLNMYDMKNFYGVELLNEYNKPIGFIISTFERPVEDSEEVMEKLHSLGDKVSSLITIRKGQIGG